MRFDRNREKAQTDESLVASLSSKRSNEALTELHARYAQKVYGYFYRMFAGDSDKAQDFVQDLFLRILEKHHQFDPAKKFYTWMFTIACNMCKTEFRHSNRIQNYDADSSVFNGTEWTDDHHTRELFNEHLQKAVLRLDEVHRSVFVLRYFNHLPLNEIADILEIPLGTVKSRLFNATAKMANELKAFKSYTNLFKLS